jgi:putative membrane protein
MLHAIKTLALPDIGAYLAGGIIGLVTFTRLLKYLLKYYHDLIVAILTGLMLGSSKLLLDRSLASNPPDFHLLGSIITGIIVVILFQYVQTSVKKKMEN